MKEEAAKKKAEAAKSKEEAVRQKEEASRMKEKTVNTRSHLTNKRSVSHEDNTGSSTSKRQKVNVNNNNNDAIIEDTGFDDNQCCACFLMYKEDQLEQIGLLWVKCVCKRWIHENCYEDVLAN